MNVLTTEQNAQQPVPGISIFDDKTGILSYIDRSGTVQTINDVAGLSAAREIINGNGWTAGAGDVFLPGSVMYGTYTVIGVRSNKMTISITEAGLQELNDIYEREPIPDDLVLITLLEEHTANSSLETVEPYEITALTDSLILTFDGERDDWNNLVSVGTVYWYPNYALQAYTDVLSSVGFIEFDGMGMQEPDETEAFDTQGHKVELQTYDGHLYVKNRVAASDLKLHDLVIFSQNTRHDTIFGKVVYANQLNHKVVISAIDHGYKKELNTENDSAIMLSRYVMLSALELVEASHYPTNGDKPARFYVARNDRADGYPYSVVVRFGYESKTLQRMSYTSPLEISTHYNFDDAYKAATRCHAIYDKGTTTDIPHKPYRKTITLGTDEGKRRVNITIELRPKKRGYELSIVGEVSKRAGSVISCGQIIDALTDGTIRNYWVDRAKVERIAEVWSQWHLNDMTPGCVHVMESGLHKVVIGEDRYGAKKTAGWTTTKEHPDGILSKPCHECGYKYGTSWLHTPIPQEIIEEVMSW